MGQRAEYGLAAEQKITESKFMSTIHPCELPEGALLSQYAGTGSYADCYAVEVLQSVSHIQFVEAFYTTAVFKIERFILGAAVSRPSTDAEVGQLARGEVNAFAAWTVEGRADHQLLLCDFAGRTRSWLMVVPARNGGAVRTRLYFGSAVVPARAKGDGRSDMGWVFRALLGFHKLYSRVLLRAAVSRLSRQVRKG